MGDDYKVGLVAVILCGIIFLVLIFRNYSLNIIENETEKALEEQKFSLIQKMVNDGHSPMIAGCSLVNSYNADFCKSLLTTKQIIDSLKEQKDEH